jgi:hypothetical protein
LDKDPEGTVLAEQQALADAEEKKLQQIHRGLE